MEEDFDSIDHDRLYLKKSMFSSKSKGIKKQK
jgi:hypothetical protein